GFDRAELAIEPEPAGPHFAGARPAVDAALAARLELEMLDRVGHIGPLAVEPGRRQRAVEDLSGRSDKRATGQILLVAGLFADKHQGRIGGTFSEYSLGGAGMQRTACAGFSLARQRSKRTGRWAAGWLRALRQHLGKMWRHIRFTLGDAAG